MYSIVLQLDQTGVGCNGSSLTHYVLWKFTNAISLLPFLISQTYTYVQYSNVTGVLSLDATCMVSWNHSVEYMYTRSSVCGRRSCWMVNCRGWGGGCNGPCLRQNVTWHFHALFVIPNSHCLQLCSQCLQYTMKLLTVEYP